MAHTAKRELLKAIQPRYLKASKAEKTRRLDEVVAVTNHNRKCAFQLLRHGPPRRSTKQVGRKRTYSPDALSTHPGFS